MISLAISVRLRDLLPLLVAFILVVLCFTLPPFYEDGEAEPVTAGAEPARVLIIDAGHGGEDGGATTAEGVPESGINLAIACKLEALAGLFGVETVMTRESQDISYPESAATTAQRKQSDQKARIELINAQENAVLISIHQNYYPDARPSGCQVLYGKPEGSRELGELTHKNLTEALCPTSRRVAAPISEDIYLMRSAKCTSILVECGFLSNPSEAALLQTEDYQLKISALLLASYLQYEAGSDGMVL